MRVDEYKIDNFSNMIGELVIARNSYEYLLSEILSRNTIEQNTEKRLNDNLHLFSRLTNDLQVGVTTLRMVPLKSTFQKYSRVVRDISKKQSKKIDFVTLGNETEVDKNIADSLSDPLIHLIRNSCDHGIEVPEERVKLGKPGKGTILLKASIEGGKLIIVIKDDGKGLDRKRIYEKAKIMGINTSNYDDNTILDLVFKPGFSTKTEVSELSGRGVGMDVVKTTIDKLGGNINVMTEENIGTEITFVIPMSIGLSESLIVEAKGETYALPVQSVVKTLKLEPSKFSRLHDRLMFNHRGEVIPTATLVELLNGKSGEIEIQLNTIKEKIFNNETEEIPVVIIQTKKGNYGIIVDKLKKNIELSVKPVPECIARSNVISGVSILGDGNVVLVLNPEKLI
jgi:two-component system chemotaxis sensor kinase CheA